MHNVIAPLGKTLNNGFLTSSFTSEGGDWIRVDYCSFVKSPNLFVESFI